MKKIFLLVLLMSLCGGLLSAEEFRTRREVERDARARMRAVVAAAAAPQQGNYVRLDGTVASVFTSPEVNFGAFGLTNLSAPQLFDGRVECGNFQAEAMGCYDIVGGDAVVVYAHLESYQSCRFDGTDMAVKLNLLYKRLPSGAWVLLTR